LPENKELAEAGQEGEVGGEFQRFTPAGNNQEIKEQYMAAYQTKEGYQANLDKA
jgi:hypothetical protein